MPVIRNNEESNTYPETGKHPEINTHPKTG